MTTHLDAESTFVATYQWTTMGWRQDRNGKIEFFTEKVPAEPPMSQEELRRWLDAEEVRVQCVADRYGWNSKVEAN